MELTQYDMFAYQILHYLVVKQNYQIVRVEQHQDDLWLMNARQELYPVIRISSKSNAGTLSDTEYIRNVHRLILNLIHREGPIMIFNTNPESTPIHNEVMTQIRITPNQISNQEITKTFKDIDHILHHVDDYQSELAVLTKEVEEIQLKRQDDLLKKSKTKKVPKVTIAVIMLCIVYTILTLICGYLLNNTSVAAVVSGAYYKMNVVAAHEYWRLLTAGFLHEQPITLLVNMYAFYSIGKYSEQIFTKGQYILILLISIIAGNVFVLIGDTNSIVYGISGGVCGIFGAYIAVLLAHGTIRHPLVRLTFINLIWSILLVVLFSNISVYALLGSFLCGALLGLLFDTALHWTQMKTHVKIAGCIAVTILGYMVVTKDRVDATTNNLDDKIINVYRHTSMNWYADYLSRCYQKQYRME